jgi:hypothetical protein
MFCVCGVGTQATTYTYSGSTTCTGTAVQETNAVHTTCVSSDSTDDGTVSLTSVCTNNAESDDNNVDDNSGQVGVLTGVNLIWAMIGALFAISLLAAIATTFMCPNCIDTGYGKQKPDALLAN